METRDDPMDITVREIAAPMLEGKRGAEFNKEYNRVHHILGQYTLGLARKHYDTAKAAQGIIDAEHKDVVVALRAEVARLRDKLTAMHRRAQDAESAAMEKGAGGPSFGRALANAGYNMMRERAEKAEGDAAALKAELAGYQEANHAVAVCRNHTNDIITRDGCVICDLARYTAPLTEEQARTIRDTIAPREDQTFSEWLKSCDAAIRAAREAK